MWGFFGGEELGDFGVKNRKNPTNIIIYFLFFLFIIINQINNFVDFFCFNELLYRCEKYLY